MARRDILTPDFELLVEGGDWAVGTSDEQHIRDILKAAPGDFHEQPLLGVGIDAYLHAAPLEAGYKSEALAQLERDGYREIVVEIDRLTGAPIIDAKPPLTP